MTTPSKPPGMTSFRSYLLQAGYAWIVDNDMSPHILVDASVPGVSVPSSATKKDGQILLNISPRSIANLCMDHEGLQFHARFSGKSFLVRVPMDAVRHIFAKESQMGMELPPVNASGSQPRPAPVAGVVQNPMGPSGPEASTEKSTPPEPPTPPPGGRSRSHLRVIK